MDRAEVLPALGSQVRQRVDVPVNLVVAGRRRNNIQVAVQVDVGGKHRSRVADFIPGVRREHLTVEDRRCADHRVRFVLVPDDLVGGR